MKSFANITVNRLLKHSHSASCTLKMTFLKILHIVGHVMKEMKIRIVSIQGLCVVDLFCHQCGGISDLNSDLCLPLPEYQKFLFMK